MVQRVFPTLTFRQPVGMFQEPGNNARWYVIEKTGAIRVFNNSGTPGTPREFLNLSGRLNSNPGSKSAPLRTIQRAADLARPGDVITVHEGIYRERVNPPRGGTSAGSTR